LLTFDYGKKSNVHSTDIFISPNPANASLRVAVAPTSEGTGQVQIEDLLGHLMFPQGVSGVEAWELPVHSWPDGIYMFHYQHAEGIESRLVFIKH